jgi:excisionase family DNA binding protein
MITDEAMEELEEILKGYAERIDRIADDDLLTIKLAAQVCGVDEKTIRRHVLSGELRAAKIGDTYRILESTLLRWLLTKHMPANV